MQKTGKPCPWYAMEGQLVCHRHGGNAPQAKMAAKLKREEELGKNTLARLGVEPVGNALQELARLAGECVAWKDAMGGKVNELTEAQWRYKANAGEQVRAELLLWERALDRCIQVLSAMARITVDERLARIEERKVELLADALSTALAQSGVPAEMSAEVRRRFARKLVAIAS